MIFFSRKVSVVAGSGKWFCGKCLTLIQGLNDFHEYTWLLNAGIKRR